MLVFRFLLQTANIAAARHQFHVVRLMLTWHLPRLRKEGLIPELLS